MVVVEGLQGSDSGAQGSRKGKQATKGKTHNRRHGWGRAHRINIVLFAIGAPRANIGLYLYREWLSQIECVPRPGVCDAGSDRIGVKPHAGIGRGGQGKGLACCWRGRGSRVEGRGSRGRGGVRGGRCRGRRGVYSREEDRQTRRMSVGRECVWMLSTVRRGPLLFFLGAAAGGFALLMRLESPTGTGCRRVLPGWLSGCLLTEHECCRRRVARVVATTAVVAGSEVGWGDGGGGGGGGGRRFPLSKSSRVESNRRPGASRESRSGFREDSSTSEQRALTSEPWQQQQQRARSVRAWVCARCR